MPSQRDGVSVGRTAPDKKKPQVIYLVTWGFVCALGGIRTPNLLIRSQMLYPLSYGRLLLDQCTHRFCAEAPGFEPGRGLCPQPH